MPGPSRPSTKYPGFVAVGTPLNSPSIRRIAGKKPVPKAQRNKHEDLNKVLLEMEALLRESADVMHTAASIAKFQKKA